MFDNLRRDSARYASLGGWLTHAGFWIGAVYRFGMWAHYLPTPFLRIPAVIVYRLVKMPLVVFNVHLWAGRSGAKIGPGLCLIHPTNVKIGRQVEIGEDCLIFNDVTLGTGALDGRPKLGNGVDVYVGARVLGGVNIGDGVMIGANCVVTRDVPANSVVLSAPSKVLPRRLSPVARGVDEPPVEAVAAPASVERLG